MYFYITILCLLVGFRVMNNIFFPLDYEIYMIPIVEKLQSFKDNLLSSLMTGVYNILYGFSVFQIYLNKIKNLTEPYRKYLIKYLKDASIIVEEPTKSLHVIDKNGNIQTEYILLNNEDILPQLRFFFNDTEVSAVILNDKNMDTGCINKIYIEKNELVEEYKVSNIHFLMMGLHYKNKEYVINLRDDLYNYYIVNNSLNQNFFKYYLKNIQNIPINDNDFTYILTIIDNNVNIININQTQTIVIQENDYTIYPELIQNNIQNTMLELDINMLDDSSDKFDDFVKLESINQRSF